MGGVWHQIVSDLALDRLWRDPGDPSYRVAYSVTRAGIIDLVYRQLSHRRCFTDGSTVGVIGVNAEEGGVALSETPEPIL